MKKSIAIDIEQVILRLGYNGSENLYINRNKNFINKDDQLLQCKFHTLKVLREIDPFGCYFKNNEPFILFFTKPKDIKELNKKIWNAQIPVVVSSFEDNITIYSGKQLINRENIELKHIKDLKEKDCNEASSFSIFNISNYDFSKIFGTNKKKDEYQLNTSLLENIEYITNKLKLNYKIDFSTKIILRLIFIRFLIDRGVDLGYDNLVGDTIEERKTSFDKIVLNKEHLYDMFLYLEINFNGNLFENTDTELIELNKIDSVDMFKTLSDFISGKEDFKQQQQLLFSIYDFNIIPIELISNIYETVLGKETQSKNKAFYTPEFLVDYVLNITLDENKQNIFKVLDPACGSGIFLVESFKRIVEAELPKNGYFKDNSKLVKLLEENIYGVDLNEEAIDVTVFSLYLALLDYIDPKKLNNVKLPLLKDNNLFPSDFFDDSKLNRLKNIHFDFIIGNPPWGTTEEKSEYTSYCIKNEFPLPDYQIAIAFMHKIREYSKYNTEICLIIPSKTLYNQKALYFRKYILEHMKIIRVVEWSSVKKYIFKNAKAPAIIIKFQYEINNSILNKKKTLDNKIEYISIKPNVLFHVFGTITIEKNDIKYVKQELLYTNDWAWKLIVYGSYFDFEIIKDIEIKKNTISNIIETSESIIRNTGINIGRNGKATPGFLSNRKILKSKSGIYNFYLNINNTTTFLDKTVERPKNRKLFIPPYCLFLKGTDKHSMRIKSVYCDKKDIDINDQKDFIIYQDAVYIIKGEDKDKTFLLILTAMLNSSFYAYLNVMIGHDIGIERNTRIIDQIISFPFPENIDFTKVSELVIEIQEDKKKLHSGEFGNIEKDIENKIKILDDLILEAFGLKNNIFVDYALNVTIPMLTNKDKKYREVKENELKEYSCVFVRYFENLYNEPNKYIRIKFYSFSKYTIFELQVLDTKPKEKIVFLKYDELDEIKKTSIKLLIYKRNDIFYKIKDVVNFEDNSFYVTKTNEYKNWHRASSEIDLSYVIDNIMSD